MVGCTALAGSKHVRFLSNPNKKGDTRCQWSTHAGDKLITALLSYGISSFLEARPNASRRAFSEQLVPNLAQNLWMIVGQPLHYFYPYGQAPPLCPDQTLPFFRFAMEPSEDYPMVTSPSNSTQSDSDNSLSSIEVPSHSIAIPKTADKKQCQWTNCGATFASLSELATHVSQCHSSGGPDGLFHCGWEGCTRNNKGFNARYKMLVHVRTHTNEKPHRCCQCDKSFSRAENLKIHSRSHSGEKPYVCPVAGCCKAYSNSSDRFKHTRTHSVEKPYQCKVPGCPKRYTDPSSLRKHVKTYKHFPGEEAADSHVHVITVNNVKRPDSGMFSLQIDIKEQRFGFSDRTKLYRPYELDGERRRRDTDMPLDLSTRRSV